MSFCKYCGEKIEWLTLEDGRHIAVNEDPEFVVEGEGTGRFYDEERGMFQGRLARQEEFSSLTARADIIPAYIAHRDTCRSRQ